MIREPILIKGDLLSSAKPLLKWAGGKTQLLNILRMIIPHNYERYIEPFLGGGALLFDLAQIGSLASDSNPELIHFYKIVRDYPGELVQALDNSLISKEEYYHLRSIDPITLNPIKRAARFIYLNKTCYNGLHRVNKKGQFNTPFGGRTNIKILDECNLLKVSEILRSTELLCADYKECLRQARENDFVYLDPPYYPLGGYSDFKRYTCNFFGENEHIELAREFRRLTNAGVFVLLSNSATKQVQELYDGFNFIRIKATRQINCRPDGRGCIEEFLIANYAMD